MEKLDFDELPIGVHRAIANVFELLLRHQAFRHVINISIFATERIVAVHDMLRLLKTLAYAWKIVREKHEKHTTNTHHNLRNPIRATSPAIQFFLSFF